MGKRARTTAAVARSAVTKPAGIASQRASRRPTSNVRSCANGHGTRPAHAAPAHVASASETPTAAGSRVRLSFTRTRPASIHPAHCQPALVSSSRIASFFARNRSARRASAISSEPCASASGRDSDWQLVRLTDEGAGSVAEAATLPVRVSPSIAAASSRSAFWPVAGALRSSLVRFDERVTPATWSNAQASGRGPEPPLASSA